MNRMKKRLRGLLALMLTVIVGLSAMPMNVKAATSYKVSTYMSPTESISGGDFTEDLNRTECGSLDLPFNVADLEYGSIPEGYEVTGWKLWSVDEASGSVGVCLEEYDTKDATITEDVVDVPCEGLLLEAQLKQKVTGDVILVKNGVAESVFYYNDTVTVQIGNTNMGGTGNWFNALHYEWYCEGMTDPVGTSQSFTITEACIGKNIWCQVTVDNFAGSIVSEKYPVYKATFDENYKPQKGVVKDDYGTDTFCYEGFDNYEYEYRVRKNEAADWSAWVNADGLTNISSGEGIGIIPVGNVNRAVGCVQVRLKENATYVSTDNMILSNTEPFTAVLKESVTLSGEAVCGKTLTAVVSLEEALAGENPTLNYTFKRGDEVVQAASTTNTYVISMADVGKQITVEVTSPDATGTLTATSAEVSSGSDAKVTDVEVSDGKTDDTKVHPDNAVMTITATNAVKYYVCWNTSDNIINNISAEEVKQGGEASTSNVITLDRLPSDIELYYAVVAEDENGKLSDKYRGAFYTENVWKAYTYVSSTEKVSSGARVSDSANLKSHDRYELPINVADLEYGNAPEGYEIVGWNLWNATNEYGNIYAGNAIEKVYGEKDITISESDVEDCPYSFLLEAVLKPVLKGTVSIQNKSATNVETPLAYKDRAGVTYNITNSEDVGTIYYKWYCEGVDTPVSTESYFDITEQCIGKNIWCEITAENTPGSIVSEKYPVGKAVYDEQYAPNNGVVNDAYGTDTFSFEGYDEYQYEYRVRKDEASEWSAWVTADGLKDVTSGCGTGAIAVGNVNRAAGCVQVRIKDTDKYVSTDSMILTNTAPFTAVLKDSVTLTGDAVYGGTLTATVALEENLAGENPALNYTFKCGDKVLQAASTVNTYKVGLADVGKQITVEVTSPNATGTLTATSTEVPALDITINGVVVTGKTYDGTTAATVESVTFTRDGKEVNLVKDVDYKVTSAVYDSADAGTDRKVTVSVELIGEAAKTYALANGTYVLENQSITPKKPAADTPHIKDDEGNEGWEAIRGVVADAKDGETVTVDMNGVTVIPGNVIKDIKDKNVTIVLDMGNGITWSINGKDVTSDDIKDIDLGVTIGSEDTIPVDVVNKVTGERSHMNVTLAYEGEFGFTAFLSINLESKNAGLYANLFYYNEDKKELEFIYADEIAADGTVELPFTHASEYTIVIDKASMEPQPDDTTNQGGAVSPDSGDEAGIVMRNCLFMMLCAIMVLGVTGTSIFTAKRKREE